MYYYPYGVSFIVPCWNEEATIAACLQSINRERMKHPELDTEIIVVDNNCLDNTAALAHKSMAKVVTEPKKGVVHARQRGATAAQYSLIANIDADCTLPKGWLTVVLDTMQDQATVAISGPYEYGDVPAYIHWGTKAFYLLARLCHHIIGPMIQGGNYVIRQDTLVRMGGYDTSVAFYGEDTKTAADASAFGKIRMIPEMEVYSSPRRLYGQGILKTVWLYSINYLSIALFTKVINKQYKDFR